MNPFLARQGVSVDQLKENVKEVLQAEKKRLSEANAQAVRAKQAAAEERTSGTSSAPSPPPDSLRKDSSPVKVSHFRSLPFRFQYNALSLSL